MTRILRKAPNVTLTSILWSLAPWVLVAATFVVAGVTHVTSRVLVVDAGYKLSALEQQNRELTREHDRLKLELATLKSPTRLERIAREQLGMLPPPPGGVISVGSSLPRLGRSAPRERSAP